jgi:hypothetical protein
MTTIIDNIVAQAVEENKNILIIGTPRSGTHALGSMIANKNSFKYNAEILRLDINFPWQDDFKMLADHSNISVSQIVQYTSKIKFSKYISEFKEHVIFVALRRRDKLKQFASWIYFNRLHNEVNGWHSQIIEFNENLVGRFLITDNDIELFLVEQLLDSFYAPAYTLYYEDLTFEGATQTKNVYKFDPTTIFRNLEFVKDQLADWRYPDEQ